jgi:hypothetical protein
MILQWKGKLTIEELMSLAQRRRLRCVALGQNLNLIIRP